MITTTKKFGKQMSVQAHLLGLHRDHCLCWKGCKHFKPNDSNNCPIANDLFEFDKKYGVTTPVWECETYDTDKEE